MKDSIPVNIDDAIEISLSILDVFIPCIKLLKRKPSDIEISIIIIQNTKKNILIYLLLNFIYNIILLILLSIVFESQIQ